MIRYTCPLSFNKIDHNVVRLAGFFTLILIALTYMKILGKYSNFIMLFVTFDFLARIFNDKFSLLKLISVNVLHGLLKIKPEEVGAAPKRFAAGLGATFSAIIFVLLILNQYWLGEIQILNINNLSLYLKHTTHFITMLLVLAISMETFFGFCIGCKIYSYLQWIKSWFKK